MSRAEFGQFLTPPDVAAFMASFFERFEGAVRVLDAGAGVGSLLSAFMTEASGRRPLPSQIQAVAYEIDPSLCKYLRRAVGECRNECGRAGIRFSAEVVEADFIASAVELLDVGRSQPEQSSGFTHAILNPPYKKLSSTSPLRRALRRVGINANNLYAAFLALAIRLLQPGGELVAITPRSFCNGPYFRPFREMLLEEVALRRIHVFESRTAAFADDQVLQETVIVHAVKGRSKKAVVVSKSISPKDPRVSRREVPPHEIVRPGDPELFIRVVPDQNSHDVAEVMGRLPARLRDLDLSVSTGRVVDYRARPFLRADPGPGAGPLIHPTHFSAGGIRWPKPGKKPNALALVPETEELWMPGGTYVLVKRFSSKEEPRRIMAAVFDPTLIPAAYVGFENHLNVFHANGAGLPPRVARGLAAFLNSTLVDTYFRQFNGHTQVNATDLRSFKYPRATDLERLGATIGDRKLEPDELDELVEEVAGVVDDRGALQGDEGGSRRSTSPPL